MRKKNLPMGELALIARIRDEFGGKPNRFLKLGIGDDCAILRPPSLGDVLVTTDFSLENRHFRRDWHSPESAGHRCLARGLSDLAAMGATPMAAFLSLALPGGTTKSWIDRFFRGLRALADRHALPLAGGDTSESPSELIFADIVLVGTVPAGRSLRRNGAHPGDILYVTGALGGAAAELERMRTGKVRRVRTGSWLAHPQMFPEPRIDAGSRLMAKQLATACMDVSDGLSTDLSHLCKASGVGAEIDVDALPLHPLAAALTPGKGLQVALHGGEDYELLFTAPAGTKVPRKVADVAITAIGRMTRTKGVFLREADGQRRALLPGGWEHLRG